MKKYWLVILVVFAGACKTQQKTAAITAQNNITVDGKLWTSLYQQKAAEYSALCFQAYNIARLRIDESLQTASSKPKAIITDIDETMFDNSPYAVHQALQGKDYDDDSWMRWTSLAQCDTLAGSLSFFKYAAEKNIEIFYITNRDVKERKGTLQNLQHFRFPFADSAHLLLKQNSSSSKESRRQQIMAKYEVVLLLGDNLADFSSLFDKKTTEERLENVQSSASAFGDKFIVLPNADYGDWESALYNYNYKLSAAQKDSVIKANLKSY